MPLSVRDYLTKNPRKGIANPNAEMIRAMTVAELKDNEDKYIQWWDYKAPSKDEEVMLQVEGTSDPDPAELKAKYDEYLKMLSKKGAWMGDLELGAMASKFDIPIRVWTREGPGEIYNEGSKAPVCDVWFDELHYEWCPCIPEVKESCTLDVLGYHLALHVFFN